VRAGVRGWCKDCWGVVIALTIAECFLVTISMKVAKTCARPCTGKRGICWIWMIVILIIDETWLSEPWYSCPYAVDSREVLSSFLSSWVATVSFAPLVARGACDEVNPSTKILLSQAAKRVSGTDFTSSSFDHPL
jgi:hypothetical protein